MKKTKNLFFIYRLIFLHYPGPGCVVGVLGTGLDGGTANQYSLGLTAGEATIAYGNSSMTVTVESAPVDNNPGTGVPEPISITVFGAGIAGVVAARRRRV